MADILLWPDPRLASRCDLVGDADVADLVTTMFETMYAAPGRGLAASQIGVMKRVFVMDCGWKDGEMTPLVCIDPEILWSSDAVGAMVEGCLSIPDTPVAVTRPLEIRLAFTDLTGARQDRHLTGFEARCAQHEFDHLEGRVIFDRVDPETAATLVADYKARRA